MLEEIETLKELIDWIDTNGRSKTALFFGAGVSRNSGVPVVNELKHEILTVLGLDHYYDILTDTPFELFMESLIRYSNDKILDIFKLGYPNLFHEYVATAIDDEFLLGAVTTNFDMLLEKASLAMNLNIKSEYIEENFSINKLRSPFYYKIHGSIEDKNSTRIFMHEISVVEKIKQRENLMNKFFNSKMYEYIIVLGYSCSDYFDIVPIIEKTIHNDKKIIFINHRNTYGINIREIDNCFKNFDGVVIDCNTDTFIEEMYLKITGEKKKIRKRETEWKEYIENLQDNFSEKCLKYFFISGLLQRRGNFIESTVTLEEALKMQNISKKVRIEAYNGITFNIFNQIRLGELEDHCAKKYYYIMKSLNTIKNIDDIRLKKSTYSKYARMLILDGKFEKAKNILDKIRNLVYNSIDDTEKNTPAKDKSEYIISTFFDLEAFYYLEKYKIKKNTSDLFMAENIYLKAYNIFNKLGGYVLEKGILNYELAEIYFEKRDYKKALIFIDNGKNISVNIGDNLGKKQCEKMRILILDGLRNSKQLEQ